MCSCRSPAVQWTAQPRLSTLPWQRPALELERQRPAHSPRLALRLQLPRRWGLQETAMSEPGRELPGDCRVHGGRVCESAVRAQPAAAALLHHRPWLRPRMGSPCRRLHLKPQATVGRGLLRYFVGLFALRKTGLQWLRFLLWRLLVSFAVCAACRGRASICACCTCNTLASSGAIRPKWPSVI